MLTARPAMCDCIPGYGGGDRQFIVRAALHRAATNGAVKHDLEALFEPVTESKRTRCRGSTDTVFIVFDQLCSLLWARGAAASVPKVSLSPGCAPQNA